jgi:hypothetical protein
MKMEAIFSRVSIVTRFARKHPLGIAMGVLGVGGGLIPLVFPPPSSVAALASLLTVIGFACLIVRSFKRYSPLSKVARSATAAWSETPAPPHILQGGLS